MAQSEYLIGGKVFAQKELVMGQIEHLALVLSDVQIPAGISEAVKEGTSEDTQMGYFGRLIASMGSKLPVLLSIVLFDKETGLAGRFKHTSDNGVDLKLVVDMDKLGEMASFLAENATTDIVLSVIRDFFAINPISSMLEKIQTTIIEAVDLASKEKKM